MGGTQKSVLLISGKITVFEKWMMTGGTPPGTPREFQQGLGGHRQRGGCEGARACTEAGGLCGGGGNEDRRVRTNEFHGISWDMIVALWGYDRGVLGVLQGYHKGIIRVL